MGKVYEQSHVGYIHMGYIQVATLKQLLDM